MEQPRIRRDMSIVSGNKRWKCSHSSVIDEDIRLAIFRWNGKVKEGNSCHRKNCRTTHARCLQQPHIPDGHSGNVDITVARYRTGNRLLWSRVAVHRRMHRSTWVEKWGCITSLPTSSTFCENDLRFTDSCPPPSTNYFRYNSTVDIRLRVSGGGATSQIYAIRQAIAKSLVAYYAKYYDAASALELRQLFVAYDRTLLIADTRRSEPKKFGGHGARARRQKSYR